MIDPYEDDDGLEPEYEDEDDYYDEEEDEEDEYEYEEEDDWEPDDEEAYTPVGWHLDHDDDIPSPDIDYDDIHAQFDEDDQEGYGGE